jgi:hypothetical protein
MPEPRLHLDADTSSRRLQQALLSRGHDVTRTPNDWMPDDATDEMQLLGATARGRCIFTFNIPDFMRLAYQHPQHGGIILTEQEGMSLSELIFALDRLLCETDAADWPDRVRWLNDWRPAEADS